MTDPQSQSRYVSLKQRGRQLMADTELKDLTRDLTDITNAVDKLDNELARLRKRGYAFAAYLEQKVTVLGQRWQSVRQGAHAALGDEIMRLRADRRQAEMLLDKSEAVSSHPGALESILPSLDNELKQLDTTIRAAEHRIKAQYQDLERDVNQTVEQLRDIHWYLDQQDEASFPLLAEEKLFLVAEAESQLTGRGKDDPDGLLYLTDQRLVFEQKEKTGKKLGLFGGKHTQEMAWEAPLHLVEQVEAENKGLFGGKDLLHFTMGAGAPFPRITVEVKGKAKCKFWAAQIDRMIQGGASDERAIQPDQETLESIRNAPTACPVCGATLPRLVANQRQTECAYCGTVVRV